MTVSELIEKLQKVPGHLQVSVNDETNGYFHDTVESVFHMQEDVEYGDPESVVLIVNGVD